MRSDGRLHPIEHKGLRYLWHSGAFLSIQEARYALERVWRLCAGVAEWYGSPSLEILACDRQCVEAMHAMTAGSLPWVEVAEVLPRDIALPIDTTRLPAFCQPRETNTPAYSGQGPFPLDIVAATFLMLSRWEESNWPCPLDRHGRAQAAHCLAYRQGFLHRPIIDEWALVLRSWLRVSSPGWAPQIPRGKPIVTFDLDRPRRYPTLWRVVRAALAEILVRSHNPVRATRHISRGFKALYDAGSDPNVVSTHEQADACRQLGTDGTVYIMTARYGEYDEGYDVTKPPIREQFEQMRALGYRIGWHPGYRAAHDEAVFADEKTRMDNLLGDSSYGGRYHYLRWSASGSWDQWEQYGLQYDSSVGYADNVGFRCGTCHPFPCFSLTSQRPLTLVEEPLVIMDCALEAATSEQSSASVLAEQLISRSRAVGGQPVLLLHNSDSSPVIRESLLAAVRKVYP